MLRALLQTLRLQNPRLQNHVLRTAIVCLVALLSACSTAEKKVYPQLPAIPATIDVQPLWVASEGARSDFELRQLPVTVRDNEIYLAHARGEVNALALNNGQVQWRVDVHDKISGGPAVGRGIVVVSTEDAGLIALAQNNGKELWRTTLSSVALSRPLISDDKLFVQTIDEKIYALNIKDGSRIWVEGNESPPLSLRGTARPLMVGSKVITGFADGRLIAFNAATGKTLWEATIAVPHGRTDLERVVDIDGILAVDDHMIYVSTFQGRIAAVSTNDGRIVWNREMSSYQGVALDDGQLYVTDAEGFVWALDRKTGATLWRQEKLKDRDVSAPRVMAQAVVVADGGGYVHWLSKEDGDFLARESLKQLHQDVFVDWGDDDFNKLNYGVSTIPEVSDDLALVRNNTGDLAVFRVWPKGARKIEKHWFDSLGNLFSAR
jgi:outer membrane protein assembly factor BamB